MNLKFSLLGITGWSGSGKTTLLEKLIPILIGKGCRINVIKRSHHDVQIEPERKDSARMRAAGAAEVLLSSPQRYMLVHELRGAEMPLLDELIGRMAPADMTLLEGGRDESIPKLEIFRPALGKDALYTVDEYIVAVASDVPCPADLPRPLEWLDLNDPEKIGDWLFQNQSPGK